MAQRSVSQLTGILPDINALGSKGFEAGPGLRFNIPLFHQNQGEIAQAPADAERLRCQYAHQRDRAALEKSTVSLLLVLETTRQFLNAQLRDCAAEADHRRAMAELERSVGHRLSDVISDDSMHTEMLPVPLVELREDIP